MFLSKSIAFLFLVQTNLVAANRLRRLKSSSEVQLHPSHDTFVRRDKGDAMHGNAPKITVTQLGANQRIGMMKFDTAGHVFDEDTEATLMLSVAEAHEQPVQVKVYRVMSDFHEDQLSWNSFDGNVGADQVVTFTANKDKTNMIEEIDVSSLLKFGQDVTFAFVVDEGHVKFHSKDTDMHHHLIPKLVLKSSEL